MIKNVRGKNQATWYLEKRSEKIQKYIRLPGAKSDSEKKKGFNVGSLQLTYLYALFLSILKVISS